MAISLEDPLLQTFETFVEYSAILALKILGTGILTGLKRFTRKSFVNPEDATKRNVKVTLSNEEIERLRRAHRNDLENIPAFWLLGALYLTTGPIVIWATFLFRIFTIARIAHTFVYAIVPIRQPAREIAYLTAFFINVYMGIQVVLYYCTAL